MSCRSRRPSVSTGTNRSPNCCASAPKRSSRRAVPTTFSPATSAASARASPRPAVAPVMIHVLWVSLSLMHRTLDARARSKSTTPAALRATAAGVGDGTTRTRTPALRDGSGRASSTNAGVLAVSGRPRDCSDRGLSGFGLEVGMWLRWADGVRSSCVSCPDRGRRCRLRDGERVRARARARRCARALRTLDWLLFPGSTG